MISQYHAVSSYNRSWEDKANQFVSEDVVKLAETYHVEEELKKKLADLRADLVKPLPAFEHYKVPPNTRLKQLLNSTTGRRGGGTRTQGSPRQACLCLPQESP